MPETLQTKSEMKPNKVEDQPRAKQLIAFYQKLKGQRTNFESYWQTLHDYFYIEAQDVSALSAPGQELSVSNLWDSTTLEASDVLASGFMNYLTPPTSKWFRLTTKEAGLRENKAVQQYLEDVAEEVHFTLNRSNFYDQMFSSYKSSGVYGTSAMIEEEDIDDAARFYSLPVKQVCLVEDGRGRVSEYYIEFEYTASQAETRWGREKLSEKMKQELDPEKRQENKHLFLLYIAKRSRRDVSRSDKKNLPIEAAWIDLEGEKIIDEGGYNEFPAMCHRFDKRPFIPWGYSPAMKALPFARILNAIAKTNLRAMMKHTDPPIAIPDNAFIMPFNANPRAVNYYNKNKMESKDIFAFGNFGDTNTGMTSIEYYSQKVKTLMYNDVFLAFDNITKQMNNPEVMERINEKMSMLGPAVGRYISEMLNPVVIRTIGILFRAGRLPRPPDELIENPSYEIDCISQLAQSQRRSELNSLVTGLGLVGQMAQFDPAVLDKISSDKVVDEAWSIVGAPVRVLRDDAEIADIRQNRGQMAAQAQQMAMLQAGSNVVKTGSEIDKNVAQSKQVKK
jgi:hypothetical protein